MLYLPSPQETLAWAEADSEAWAERAAAAYAAAIHRSQERPAGGDQHARAL